MTVAELQLAPLNLGWQEPVAHDSGAAGNPVEQEIGRERVDRPLFQLQASPGLGCKNARCVQGTEGINGRDRAVLVRKDQAVELPGMLFGCAFSAGSSELGISCGFDSFREELIDPRGPPCRAVSASFRPHIFRRS
jgi:hypothetical protein